MPELISSTGNSIIKLARSLKTKKNRDETGLFLVEGILHVGEVFEAGWSIDAIIYCPQILKSEFGLRLVGDAIEKKMKCVLVTESVFETFSEKENPQGLAALVRQRQKLIEEMPSFKLLVALVTPQDAGNVGTIIRTIDAVGADGLILLDGGADPYQPTVVRASMGTIFWKPFYSTSFTEFAYWTTKNNYRIIGTSAHGELNPKKIKLGDRPTILLLGSEQKGLLPEQIKYCEQLIALPMRGRATSLNLSVAAGIFLYQLMEQS